MIRVAAWCFDVSDSGLKRLVQLGVECADAVPIPTDNRGVFDLDGAITFKKHIASFGMAVNRVHLEMLSEKAMVDDSAADQELNLAAESLEVLGKAGYPLVRLGVAHLTDPWMVGHYQAAHRGGYMSRGDSLALGESDVPPPLEVQQQRWAKVCQGFEKLVPVAEEYGLKLMMHPSDPPTADSLFGGLNFHRLIDAFPNACVGYLYCCGTRGEAGGLRRSTRGDDSAMCLFEIHFRNIRGNFATAGAFEEVLLDDGDMNMFKILLELKRIGYNGALNADHYPALEGDVKGGSSQSLAYSVGYMKAMLAALACV